jgi:hypothetical protein
MLTLSIRQRTTCEKLGKLCILVLALACVAVPRLHKLEHPSLTYNELNDYASSLRFSDHPSVFAPIARGYLDGQLPFFCASGFYRLWGRSEVVARLQSVMASLLAILLAFTIVRKMHGFWYGLLVVVMLGFCPFYLSASRLAFTHGHVLCTLPLLGGLLYLHKLHSAVVAGNDTRGNRWQAGMVGLCLGLAAGCDLLALFWILSIVVVIHVWIIRGASPHAMDYLKYFVISCFLGTLIASPMYLAGFPGCVRDILAGARLADSQTGYLWLGDVVERLPPYYYGVVLLAKLTPVILILAVVTVLLHVRRFPFMHRFCTILLLSCWPIICLSFKSWKSPYYLIPFLPVFYILIVDGLHALFSTAIFRSRPFLAALVILLSFLNQAYAVARIHPDHLMQGIRYSDRLYGEYQGPAVSHGQWIGEAFSFIKQDCQDRRAFVYAVDNVGTPMIRYYAKKHGIQAFVGELPPADLKTSVTNACNVYVLITRDSKEMICPFHKNAIEDNKALVAFVEESDVYSPVRVFRSGGIPMVWVFRHRLPEGPDSIPASSEELLEKAVISLEEKGFPTNSILDGL